MIPAYRQRGFSDELSIDTPEQVELNYSVAGVGSRFIAVLLDSLIIFGFYVIAILALVLIFSGAARIGLKAAAELDTAAKWVLAIFILLNFLLLWGYFALFEALWHGQTPGKRAMKLRVIKDSGRQITFFESLARNLLRFVDYLPGLYLTGVIAMLCNRHNKRLGDLAAGTLVIHEPLDPQPLLVQGNTLTPAGWAHQAATPWEQPAPMFPADAVARLSTHDLAVLEAFFARMLDLPLQTRAEVAYKIAAQTAAKMGVPLPDRNPERVMESIVWQMRNGQRHS